MKSTRQQKILEIIKSYPIETQEELSGYLKEAGFDVTQATVSRDIRELKLVKKTNEKKKLCYQVMEQKNRPEPKYIRVWKDSILSMDTAMNLLVIKTIPGMAMAAAAALDSCQYPEVVGCIAGDDTLMCAVRTVQDAILLKQKIEMILE